MRLLSFRLESFLFVAVKTSFKVQPANDLFDSVYFYIRHIYVSTWWLSSRRVELVQSYTHGTVCTLKSLSSYGCVDCSIECTRNNYWWHIQHVSSRFGLEQIIIRFGLGPQDFIYLLIGCLRPFPPLIITRVISCVVVQEYLVPVSPYCFLGYSMACRVLAILVEIWLTTTLTTKLVMNSSKQKIRRSGYS